MGFRGYPTFKLNLDTLPPKNWLVQGKQFSKSLVDTEKRFGVWAITTGEPWGWSRLGGRNGLSQMLDWIFQVEMWHECTKQKCLTYDIGPKRCLFLQLALLNGSQRRKPCPSFAVWPISSIAVVLQERNLRPWTIACNGTAHKLSCRNMNFEWSRIFTPSTSIKSNGSDFQEPRGGTQIGFPHSCRHGRWSWASCQMGEGRMGAEPWQISKRMPQACILGDLWSGKSWKQRVWKGFGDFDGFYELPAYLWSGHG